MAGSEARTQHRGGQRGLGTGAVSFYDRHALRRALLFAFLLVTLAVAGSATAASATRADLHDTTIPLGTSYTIMGQTGAPDGRRRATGSVVLTGKLNGGPWIFLARTHTSTDGTYRVTIKPTRRGRLLLRLATPDHQVRRVTLTIT
jgi:hypothetical protein